MCGLVGMGLLGAAPRVHADPLYSVAKGLAKGADKLPDKRVAILLFPYENGDVSSGSTFVSEQLTSLLAQHRKLKVIERALLANVLSEVKLEESGVTASSGPATLSQIQPVDAVVTGILTDLPDDVTIVNARMIRFPSGEILSAMTAQIERTWEDDPHAPPAPEDADKPYVLNESPLIYTPSARPVRPVPQLAEVSPYYSQGRGMEGSEAVAQAAPLPSAAPPTMVGVIPSRPRPRIAQGNDQLIYAMGLTLDGQGHSHQADRFYRHVIEASPASSPLRERAERRLSGKDRSP